MAMSGVLYSILRQHCEVIPRRGALLEIGESNWYGDISPHILLDDAADEMKVDIGKAIADGNLFCIAKAAYRVLFDPESITAVDINGTEDALRQDLNVGLKLPQQYDVVINNGTAEHVFNVAQVFRSIHDATRIGGVMIHDAPMSGWLDHGFFCLQPTLFFDMAAANEYEVVSMWVTNLRQQQYLPIESREHIASLRGLSGDLGLVVIMLKGSYRPFRVPMQGYYDGTLSAEAAAAWRAR